MSKKVLRMPDVKAKVGLQKSEIYDRISRGEFPVPIRLGQRAVGWLESEVDSYLESLPRTNEPDGKWKNTFKGGSTS